MKENQKSNKGKIIVGIVIAIVVIAGIAAALILSGGSYTDPIQAAIDITYYGDKDALEKAVPEEYFDWYEEEYGRDFEDILDNWNNKQWVDMFGSDYKVTFKVSGKKKVEKSVLDDMRELLEDEFGIQPSKVKKAYVFDVEYFVEGSKDKDSSEWEDMYSVKIGNKWYLIEYDDDYINFSYDAW